MIVERDWSILRALTFAVRVMSVEQIAQHWWGESSSESRAQVAENSLARLCKAELLNRLKLLAYPLPKITEPVIAWKVGEADPDYYAVEYKVQNRWPEKPSYIPAYEVGNKAVKYFGVNRPKPITVGQESHDLGQAQVYLTYLEHWPEPAADWKGEETYRDVRKGQKLPDAMLFDPSGEPYRVIDFAGRYDARRLKAFHEDCKMRNLPYELW